MPAPPAPHRARVTDIGEFIRHRSCQRRFRLADSKRAVYRELPFADRPFHLIDPVLIEAGRQREEAWAESLVKAELRDLSDITDGSIPWEDLRDKLARLPPGQDAFAREVAIEGSVGAFELRGQIDFVLLQWTDEGPRLRLVECKASRRDRTYHRVQVALYRRLLLGLLQPGSEAGGEAEPLIIGGAPLDPARIDAVVARIDENSGELQAILGLDPFPEVTAITRDLDELLATGGLLDGVLREPVEALPFQIDDKCDDCAFSAHCFAEGARLRRLELLGIPPSCARALRDAGLGDLDAVAELDPTSEQAIAIADDPGLTEGIESLRVRAKARRSTLPGGVELREFNIQDLPCSGDGHLPAHEHDGRRLLRVYLSVSYDYVENRVGALAAHVTDSEGELSTPFAKDEDARKRPLAGLGEEVVRYNRKAERSAVSDDEAPKAWREVRERRELRGVDLCRVQEVPWSGEYSHDNGAEQALLVGFLRELVETIADLAEGDSVPIHFYVWTRAEMRRLLEAASRVGSDLLGHLRQLFGCRESLEQLIYSCMQDEVYSRYALGWTSRGLAVATSLAWYGQRYHWRRSVGHRGREVDLGRVFYRDLFDFRERLDYHEGDPERRWARDDERGQPGVVDHRFEVRARSFDNLSAPYWRAYWGTLPRPESLKGKQAGLKEAMRDYGLAKTPGVLKAYLVARVHGLRWLDERILRKNRSIKKPPIDAADLPTFELGTRDVGDAAADFLRLDHHVKAQDWLRVHLAPARPRITAGRSLPIANLRMTNDKTVVGTIERSPGHGEAELRALSSRFSKGEGDFVRLLPRPQAEGEGPSWFDLIYRGKTCVIERMDWRKGEVELSVIPAFSKGGPDPYILPSFDFKPDSDDAKDHPFARATLDESLSDFVAGKVERRLGSKRGRHALRWFDPVEPRIPEQGAIEPGKRQRLSDFLSGLGFGPERAHRLEANRVEAILAGIEARVQLIQGPPGTGKTTTTSLALLARLLAGAARSGEIVMIAANTHTAIDTLLDRIRSYYSDFAKQAHGAGLRMPKLGMRKVTSGDDLEPTTGGVPTLKATSSITPVKALRAQGVVLLGSTTSTLLKLVGALNRAAEFKKTTEGLQTPLLIVDEASMMVTPHFLALASLVRENGSIMVAGDHRQLAPIVAHDWESEDRPPTVLYKPYVSAYEAIWRLREHTRVTPAAIRIDQLEHTHRLPPVIRALIQPLYTRDDIQLRGNASPRLPVSWDGEDPWAAIWQAGHRLLLVVHDEDRSAHHNPTEAAIIDAILGAAGELPPASVAVVTPHRAQRALLQERLAARSEAVDMIDTVERLQGGERPTILFSATESDPLVIAQRVEFILDLNRSNVAFSRTQERLVVICARSLLDYIPPEVEHYASALLWKHLRELCDGEVARAEIEGATVIIRAPTQRSLNSAD